MRAVAIRGREVFQPIYAPTPYRLLVCCQGWQHTKPSKKGVCKLVPCQYGFVAWRAEQHPAYDGARLPGAGSFCFPGLHSAYREASSYMRRAHVTQVSVRTNQDRPVWQFVKQFDGRVTGYRPE